MTLARSGLTPYREIGVGADGTVSRQAGDEVDRDMDRLMEEHGARVRGAIRQVLGRCSEEEDLTQEVFLRLMVRLRRPGEICVGAWCWRVARNVAIDFARSRRMLCADASVSDLAVGDGLDDDAIEADLGRAIREAFDRLPGRQRQALMASLDCRTERDERHARVADRLMISPKAAESLLGRARRSLREELSRRDVRVAGFPGAGLTGVLAARHWLRRRIRPAVGALAAASVVAGQLAVSTPFRLHVPPPSRPAPVAGRSVPGPSAPPLPAGPATTPGVVSVPGPSGNSVQAPAPRPGTPAGGTAAVTTPAGGPPTGGGTGATAAGQASSTSVGVGQGPVQVGVDPVRTVRRAEQATGLDRLGLPGLPGG